MKGLALVMVAMLVTAPLIAPNNPLYPVKIAFENFVETIVSVFNPKAGLDLKITHLHERINELEYAILLNDTVDAQKVIDMINSKIVDIETYCMMHPELCVNASKVVGNVTKVLERCMEHCKCPICKDKMEKTIEIIKRVERRLEYGYKNAFRYGYKNRFGYRNTTCPYCNHS